LPKSLHHKLYEIAESDLRAANILSKKGPYPQAIYFYSQAFEKAVKSAVALYLTSHENKDEAQTSEELKRNFSHGLLNLTSFTSNIFVDSGIKSYVKRGGKESDEEIQKAINVSSVVYLETLKPNMAELVLKFETSVRNCYEVYTKLKEKPFLGSEHPKMELLRELHKNPKSKYVKFNTLTRTLFPILDGMDTYARYPMKDVGFNNIAFLRGHEMGPVCLLLGEMVGELISLVPLVWEKIESIKTS
jgi:hypothetical protein